MLGCGLPWKLFLDCIREWLWLTLWWFALTLWCKWWLFELTLTLTLVCDDECLGLDNGRNDEKGLELPTLTLTFVMLEVPFLSMELEKREYIPEEEDQEVDEGAARFGRAGMDRESEAFELEAALTWFEVEAMVVTLW